MRAFKIIHEGLTRVQFGKTGHTIAGQLYLQRVSPYIFMFAEKVKTCNKLSMVIKMHGREQSRSNIRVKCVGVKKSILLCRQQSSDSFVLK